MACPEVIKLVVMDYIRDPLCLRQVADILHKRGINICHETVRCWRNRFGPFFVKQIRQRRANVHSNWRRHINEIFVRINGERLYL